MKAIFWEFLKRAKKREDQVHDLALTDEHRVEGHCAGCVNQGFELGKSVAV